MQPHGSLHCRWAGKHETKLLTSVNIFRQPSSIVPEPNRERIDHDSTGSPLFICDFTEFKNA